MNPWRSCLTIRTSTIRTAWPSAAKPSPVEIDPDLARLFALWPDLSDAGRKLLVTTAETLAGQLKSKRKRSKPMSADSPMSVSDAVPENDAMPTERQVREDEPMNENEPMHEDPMMSNAMKFMAEDKAKGRTP